MRCGTRRDSESHRLVGAKTSLSRFLKKRRKLDLKLETIYREEPERVGPTTPTSGAGSSMTTPRSKNKKRSRKMLAMNHSPMRGKIAEEQCEAVSPRLYGALLHLDRSMTKDRIARHLRDRPRPDSDEILKVHNDSPIPVRRRGTVNTSDPSASRTPPRLSTKSQSVAGISRSQPNTLSASVPSVHSAPEIGSK